MSLRTRTWSRFRTVRAYPLDLAAVSIAAVLAYYVVTNAPTGSPLRLFVAGGLVFFLPGYALLSVFFPAKSRRSNTDASRWPTRGVDTVERLGLAFVTSLALVPLGVLGLAVTEWGLTTESTAAMLAIGTVGLAQLGAVRRLLVPPEERYVVAPFAGVRRTIASNGTAKTMSATILWGAIFVMAGALVVALVAPGSAGGYTEIGLYSEDETGEVVAGDLPEEIEPGESIPVVFSVENQEGEDMEYTLVVQQQHVEDGDVLERTELRTLDASISDGNTGSAERDVTPTAEPGETVRISVLLYHDSVPAQPTSEDADDETHFWVTIADETEDEETEDNETIDVDGNETDTGDDDDGDEADGGTGIDFGELFGARTGTAVG